jgi:hypothetical protein
LTNPISYSVHDSVTGATPRFVHDRANNAMQQPNRDMARH